ncbi:MAG: hypothetical protein NC489_30655 [Ruminococcus flavefaciens]|nr:hypothetical protein [Ruminococcus flavefaciens]
MKMRLYNCLYGSRFLGEDAFGGGTYDSFLKKEYGTNSYYNCCAYTAASGALSSQRELRRLYVKTAEADIRAREAKIASTEESLHKKQRIKDSIRTYAKTGKWAKPYPGCRAKVTGQAIKPYGSDEVPLSGYERKVEEDIRGLKIRLKMLRHGLSRAQEKLARLKELPPGRIVFGTKGAYREKDSADDMDAWKGDFTFKRHRSMSLPGRHTSADCNFLVSYRFGALHVRCMDGKEAVFHGFHPARHEKEYLALLSRGKKDRRAICYSFKRCVDRDGREYVIPSVTMELEDPYANHGFAGGCVAIDQNWDCITMSDIGPNGECLHRRTIPLPMEGKTSGQVSCIIGEAMAQVGSYCRDAGKCLVIKDIDTTLKKHGLRYGSRKRNRHSSMFAYRKITACAYSQGFRNGFEVYAVDPAYTSQIAKVRYMRGMGCPIHEAASYTIGLKAMGMDGLLSPPPPIASLLPGKLGASGDIWKQWAYITKALRGVRTHLFYGKPPGAELAALRRPTLASYAKALKGRDAARAMA